MAVSGGRATCLIALGGLQAKQNLVIAEEIAGVKCEILVFVFLRQTQSDLALEDHIQLGEVLTALHNTLIRDEDSAVQSRHEVANELIAALKALTSIVIGE